IRNAADSAYVRIAKGVVGVALIASLIIPALAPAVAEAQAPPQGSDVEDINAFRENSIGPDEANALLDEYGLDESVRVHAEQEEIAGFGAAAVSLNTILSPEVIKDTAVDAGVMTEVRDEDMADALAADGVAEDVAEAMRDFSLCSVCALEIPNQRIKLRKLLESKLPGREFSDSELDGFLDAAVDYDTAGDETALVQRGLDLLFSDPAENPNRLLLAVEAYKLFDKYVQTGDSEYRKEALFYSGITLMQIGKYDSALEAFAKLHAEYSDLVDAEIINALEHQSRIGEFVQGELREFLTDDLTDLTRTYVIDRARELDVEDKVSTLLGLAESGRPFSYRAGFLGGLLVTVRRLTPDSVVRFTASLVAKEKTLSDADKRITKIVHGHDRVRFREAEAGNAADSLVFVDLNMVKDYVQTLLMQRVDIPQLSLTMNMFLKNVQARDNLEEDYLHLVEVHETQHLYTDGFRVNLAQDEFSAYLAQFVSADIPLTFIELLSGARSFREGKVTPHTIAAERIMEELFMRKLGINLRETVNPVQFDEILNRPEVAAFITGFSSEEAASFAQELHQRVFGVSIRSFDKFEQSVELFGPTKETFEMQSSVAPVSAMLEHANVKLGEGADESAYKELDEAIKTSTSLSFNYNKIINGMIHDQGLIPTEDGAVRLYKTLLTAEDERGFLIQTLAKSELGRERILIIFESLGRDKDIIEFLKIIRNIKLTSFVPYLAERELPKYYSSDAFDSDKARAKLKDILITLNYLTNPMYFDDVYTNILDVQKKLGPVLDELTQLYEQDEYRYDEIYGFSRSISDNLRRRRIIQEEIIKEAQQKEKQRQLDIETKNRQDFLEQVNRAREQGIDLRFQSLEIEPSGVLEVDQVKPVEPSERGRMLEIDEATAEIPSGTPSTEPITKSVTDIIFDEGYAKLEIDEETSAEKVARELNSIDYETYRKVVMELITVYTPRYQEIGDIINRLQDAIEEENRNNDLLKSLNPDDVLKAIENVRKESVIGAETIIRETEGAELPAAQGVLKKTIGVIASGLAAFGIITVASTLTGTIASASAATSGVMAAVSGGGILATITSGLTVVPIYGWAAAGVLGLVGLGVYGYRQFNVYEPKIKSAGKVIESLEKSASVDPYEKTASEKRYSRNIEAHEWLDSFTGQFSGLEQLVAESGGEAVLRDLADLSDEQIVALADKRIDAIKQKYPDQDDIGGLDALAAQLHKRHVNGFIIKGIEKQVGLIAPYILEDVMEKVIEGYTPVMLERDMILGSRYLSLLALFSGEKVDSINAIVNSPMLMAPTYDIKQSGAEWGAQKVLEDLKKEYPQEKGESHIDYWNRIKPIYLKRFIDYTTSEKLGVNFQYEINQARVIRAENTVQVFRYLMSRGLLDKDKLLFADTCCYGTMPLHLEGMFNYMNYITRLYDLLERKADGENLEAELNALLTEKGFAEDNELRKALDAYVEMRSFVQDNELEIFSEDVFLDLDHHVKEQIKRIKAGEKSDTLVAKLYEQYGDDVKAITRAVVLVRELRAVNDLGIIRKIETDSMIGGRNEKSMEAIVRRRNLGVLETEYFMPVSFAYMDGERVYYKIGETPISKDSMSGLGLPWLKGFPRDLFNPDFEEQGGQGVITQPLEYLQSLVMLRYVARDMLVKRGEIEAKLSKSEAGSKEAELLQKQLQLITPRPIIKTRLNTVSKSLVSSTTCTAGSTLCTVVFEVKRAVGETDAEYVARQNSLRADVERNVEQIVAEYLSDEAS
ncbi:MAG: hypothetical protein ABIG89_02340, partial [Candidatus Woesearchaeota archaeon]